MSERVGINKRVADRLLDDGVIDETDYMRAVEFARRKHRRIEEVLIEFGAIDEAKLLKYIATLHQTQFVSTSRMRKAKIDREALRGVSYKLAKHFSVYPLLLDRKNDKLIVATADPDDSEAIRELQMATRVSRVLPMVARPATVRAAIARGYEGDRSLFDKLTAAHPAEIADMMMSDPFLGRERQLDSDGVRPQLPTRPRARRGTGRPHTGEYAPPRRDRGGTGNPRGHLEDHATPPRRRTGGGVRRTGQPVGRPPLEPMLDEPGYDAEAEYVEPPGAYGAARRGSDRGVAADDYYLEDDYAPDPPGTDPGYRAPRGGYDEPEVHGGAADPAGAHWGRGRQGSRPTAPQMTPREAGYPLPPPYQSGAESAELEPESDRTPGGYSAPPPGEDAARGARGPARRHRSILPPMRRVSHAGLGFGPLSGRQHESTAPEPRIVLTSAPYLESLRVLVGLLENDRTDLRAHSAAVARLALDIGERISLADDHRDAIVLAAYLHDLGKMGSLHLTALNVARDEAHRTLTAKLWAIPAKLMASVGLPTHCIEALRGMYEQVGGGGLPEGLHGKDIPMGARILAVTDSYADLTRNPNNAHGALLSSEQAVELLGRFSGTVFDQNIIDVLQKSTSGERILTDLLADRHRVLIVDPDPEETMVLQLRMAEQGFDVHVARGLAEARTALAARPFALVVSEVDLEQPGDGLRLREELGARGAPGNWVFLSSSDSRETAKRAFSLGVDDFLTKPVATEIVVAKLTQLVERQSQKVAPRGVSGSLAEMSLADLVQVLWHGRKTCALRITDGDEQGAVHFQQGAIVNATWGDSQGETAFYRLLALGESGTFRVDPQFVPSGEPVIGASPEALLLEGMRLLDEGKVP